MTKECTFPHYSVNEKCWSSILDLTIRHGRLESFPWYANVPINRISRELYLFTINNIVDISFILRILLSLSFHEEFCIWFNDISIIFLFFFFKYSNIWNIHRMINKMNKMFIVYCRMISTSVIRNYISKVFVFN